MTIEQASKRFRVPLPKLQLYENKGCLTSISYPTAALITTMS